MLARLLYPLASLLARGVVWIFFRRLEVSGRERLPPGPVVLAANHPNSILDPVVVAAAFPERKIDFVAAAFFFRIPFVRVLFKALGVVPVFRREDDPERRGENRGTFEAVVQALHGGDTIGIFPEGNTFADPRLQEYRTGAARIALEALDGGPPGFSAPLVPVGLNYRQRHVFRSDVLVMVGTPLDPARHLELWRRDPPAAGRALTQELREGAEEVTRNLDRLEDEELMARLERLFRSEVAPVGPGLTAQFHQSKRILEAARFIQATEPAEARAIRDLLEEYSFAIDVLGLSGAHLRQEGRGYRTRDVLRYLALVLPPLVVAALPALYGVAMNLLPYLLTRPLAEAHPHEPQREAVRKLGWGALFFGTFYLAQTLAVARYLGPAPALGYLGSLPLAGFVALWWLDRIEQLAVHSRTWITFLSRRGFRERLSAVREELVERLLACARRFREQRGEPPDPRLDPLPSGP